MAINSNTQHFNIPLKPHTTRGINTISLLLVLVSLLVFLYIAVLQTKTVIFICFGILVLLTLRLLFMPAARRTFKYNNIILLLVALYWFFLGGMGIVAGLLIALAALLETRLKIKPALHISGQGVSIKDAFNNDYSWDELTNVIVKEGLITIDCKNNKLFQKEPAADIDEQDEAEINEFCRLQLNTRS